ncbi:MAG: hypothetical protein JSW50_16425 [Candidatus Latescibacterota bacterium]|nr:MAG: hypothetical protein JSW50_16425 [Candidatus Latescibacterota bacterium]
MKRTALLVVGLLFAGLTVVSAGEGTEAKWFDMENCAFCKNVTAEPGLLENMKWKHYNITNGIVTVTTVNPEYKDAYLKAHKAMEEMGTKMMSGEVDPTTVTMCGHCQAYGGFMQKGVTFDYVQADVGDIVVMTSASPETAAEIQKFGARNEKETAKMKKEMKAKKAK